MKSFNFFIIIFLVIIFGGFIFFKDGLNKPKTVISASELSQPQILYDRINYLDYSEQSFLLAKKTGRTLFFFAATTWCSNCVALDKEIKARMIELPKDITILKVDYDNDKETKAKYSVTMQTTLILLDKNGKEIKRWIGTSFDDLIENIK